MLAQVSATVPKATAPCPLGLARILTVNACVEPQPPVFPASQKEWTVGATAHCLYVDRQTVVQRVLLFAFGSSVIDCCNLLRMLLPSLHRRAASVLNGWAFIQSAAS
jgi:hypothetical protein